jgi:hypothetical protein
VKRAGFAPDQIQPYFKTLHKLLLSEILWALLFAFGGTVQTMLLGRRLNHRELACHYNQRRSGMRVP